MEVLGNHKNIISSKRIYRDFKASISQLLVDNSERQLLNACQRKPYLLVTKDAAMYSMILQFIL
jgi:hypothetical protein